MKIRLSKYQNVTEKTVANVESQLGGEFPDQYRQFVKEFDGAIPEENAVEGFDEVDVTRFIPIETIKGLISKIDQFPLYGWPIAESSGGNFIYINKDDHAIYFWDHEVEGDKKLTNSFAEFLQRLIPFDVEAVKLKPGQVKSVWVNPSFKPKFD